MQIAEGDAVHENINFVAPALRVLLRRSDRLALVRRQVGAHAGAFDVELDPKLGSLVDSLRAALPAGDPPQAVSIAGLGVFVADQPDWSGRLAGKVAFVLKVVSGAIIAAAAVVSPGWVKVARR